MVVRVIVVINKSVYDGDDITSIIRYVEIKNARLPSSDLLKNRVLPYLIPTTAAAESEIPITRSAIRATFSLNRYIAEPAPIKTHDAPDNP